MGHGAAPYKTTPCCARVGSCTPGCFGQCPNPAPPRCPPPVRSQNRFPGETYAALLPGQQLDSQPSPDHGRAAAASGALHDRHGGLDDGAADDDSPGDDSEQEPHSPRQSRQQQLQQQAGPRRLKRRVFRNWDWPHGGGNEPQAMDLMEYMG